MPSEEVVGHEPRVKFAAERIGSLSPEERAASAALDRCLELMIAGGVCPLLDDGALAGNGAHRMPTGSLLVSKSGRTPHDDGPPAMRVAAVDRFDPARWSALFRSDAQSASPTSDTPLHWAAVLEAPDRFRWAKRPVAALHGHALADERAARTLDLPISTEATAFSTPADRQALLTLLQRFPYPEHRVWIRRGHGFFVLGSSAKEALETTTAVLARGRKAGVT